MNSREQFEDWYRREVSQHSWFSYDPEDLYAKDQFEKMFLAWQASRQALKIELPEEFGEDRLVSKAERHARSEAISECRAAIEAAGLKVKP